MTIWHVGMKAVCIHNKEWYDQFSITQDLCPIFGAVYTVTAVVFDEFEYLRLDGFDGIFISKAFRPVVDDSKSYSIFTEILNRENTKLPETV